MKAPGDFLVEYVSSDPLPCRLGDTGETAPSGTAHYRVWESVGGTPIPVAWFAELDSSDDWLRGMGVDPSLVEHR